MVLAMAGLGFLGDVWIDGLVLFFGLLALSVVFAKVRALRSRSGIRSTRVAGAESSGCGSVLRVFVDDVEVRAAANWGRAPHRRFVVTGNARPGY